MIGLESLHIDLKGIDKNTLIIVAGIGGGLAAGGLLYYLLFKEKLPKKWIKVAEVTDLMYFPMKSGAGVHDKKLYCDWLGLSKHGVLRDRVLLVVNLDGKAATVREYPELVLIHLKFRYNPKHGMEIVLKAPEMETELVLQVDKLDRRKRFPAYVLGDPINNAIDCGKNAALWISEYLTQKVEGFRIVYYPSKLSRISYQYITPMYYPRIRKQDYGGYTDLTSYMLMSEESVDDLNKHLAKPVPITQFRPNIIIKGGPLFAEENWDYIKIGGAIFRNVKPCTRCMATTVNPVLGVKDPDTEPLKTLRTYKQLEDPELRSYEKFAPVLGIHMGLRQRGIITVGDSVYINVPKK